MIFWAGTQLLERTVLQSLIPLYELFYQVIFQ
jgi:hypothetical protein